jgi:hypothetical protein
MALRKIILGLAGIGLLSSGCTSLPTMKEATGGIAVRDIVLRIKCELSDAFEDQNGSWLVDEPKFAWLHNWTAQVDLILQILDTATLSPGFSANQPFHNAYNTAAGPTSISTSGAPGTSIAAISQSFAVAAGANIGGQAQRTETISFALSLKELSEWRKTPGTAELCAVADGMDLKGRLGLKEWVREALSPVASEGSPDLPEYLYGGIHPKPNATAPTAQTAAAPKPPQAVGGGKAAPQLICSSDTNIEDIKTHLAHLQDLIQKDSTYANALSVTRMAEQNATASAKDATANASSAKSLMSTLQKTVDQYYKNNMGYADVIDPSLSAEYRKHITEWAKTLKGVSSLLNHILADATVASDAQRMAIKEGDKVTGAAANANAIAAAVLKLTAPPKPGEVAGICDSVLDAENAIGSASDTASRVQYQAVVAANRAETTDNNTKSFTDYVNGLNSDVSSAPNIDPPISSIGQSVQFVLTYGGGVTPTWTFARFSGPTNPLFSVSDTRTHTLNITIGPAVPGAFKAPSQSVTQNQLNLLLNNLLPPSSR